MFQFSDLYLGAFTLSALNLAVYTGVLKTPGIHIQIDAPKVLVDSLHTSTTLDLSASPVQLSIAFSIAVYLYICYGVYHNMSNGVQRFNYNSPGPGDKDATAIEKKEI